MTTTMTAAVLRDFAQPLILSDVPTPQPDSDELLIRVRATGVCGTDVKAWSGALPGLQLPRILGHEVAGDVVQGSSSIPTGTRVACYIYDVCGTCGACTAGQPTLCPDARRLGLERNGGLAEYMTISSAQAIVMPDNMSYAAAAVSSDSVATSWAALTGAGQLKQGDRVLVVGAGGLGLNAVQIARAHNASVAAVDTNAAKLDTARRLGADIAVTPAHNDELQHWSAGGVDLALEVSGSRDGFLLAASHVRPGGCIVCCGYRPGVEFGLDSMDIVLKQLTVRGSRSASPAQTRQAVEAVAAGSVEPIIDRHLGLDEINEALTALQSGAVVGRIVVDIS